MTALPLPLNPISYVPNCQYRTHQPPLSLKIPSRGTGQIPLHIYTHQLHFFIAINLHSLQYLFKISMSTSKNQVEFYDHLPLIEEKLGGDGLIEELCKGFQMLMDADKGVITFDSLKKNSLLLGLQDLSDDDLLSMLREGDFDGDGVLNQMEFCVLMFRLSPDLMKQSEFLLEETLEHDFKTLHK